MPDTCTMRLLPKYFEQIKADDKAWEFRLFDKKRRALKIGDYIEFVELMLIGSHEEIPRTCSVRVVGLVKYEGLEGAVMEATHILDPDLVRDLRDIYPKDDVEKYGVLAIKFERV